MSQAYTFLPNLGEQIDIPQDSILSSSLFEDDKIKVVLFRFAQGQSLSEHTASKPATLHLIEGEARVQLGDDTLDAGAGAWIHMPPELPHGIEAKTPLTMLLYLIKA